MSTSVRIAPKAVVVLLFLEILFGHIKTTLADSYSFTTINDPSGTAGTLAEGVNHRAQFAGFFENISNA